MTEPTVACIMLVNSRPAMVARAVASFRAQSYANKHLLIYDTSPACVEDLQDLCGVDLDTEDVTIREASELNQHGARKTIGYLRNRAIHNAEFADIIAHFDSDDYSHPNRLSEQVALLQASGADCVGYNEALFWDTRISNARPHLDLSSTNMSAAWLYRCPSPTYGLGSSLCYWRRAWEQKPFADINHGEDVRFITGLKVRGETALYCEPRMICSIHGANTAHYAPEKDRNMWKRAMVFDEYCAKVMEMK